MTSEVSELRPNLEMCFSCTNCMDNNNNFQKREYESSLIVPSPLLCDQGAGDAYTSTRH